MRQRWCLHPWAHDLAVAHLQHVTLIQTASGIIVASVKLLVMRLCAQSEKQELEDQLTHKAVDADTLQSELQKRTADHQHLTQTLSSTQAELRSSVEQGLSTEEELRKLRRASEAQEAEAAAELESAKAQAGQITRQLSGRMQRLDALQVFHNTCSCYAISLST